MMAGRISHGLFPLVLLGVCLSLVSPALAERTTGEARLESLQAQLASVQTELTEFKAQQEAHNELQAAVLADAMAQPDDSVFGDRLRFGTYGEMHANFTEGSGSDQFDIHRLVLTVGFDFTDWIHLNTEVELEHAYTTDGSGGEFLIEQLYLDFDINERINIRVGRFLTPLGITNQRHEPTRFNGVERPTFDKYIIPTTWSSDGIGIFGQLNDWMTYELYVVAGLDGSKFNATNGIRKGRIKERPSLHSPAITGRLDFFPLTGKEVDYDQELRFGVSTYVGGLDNGNKGKNPDIDGCVQIYSADFEYSVDRWDFRGAMAWEYISNAKEIGNGTAEQIFGAYIEGAYHWFPDAWKKGKLAQADSVVFARYDYVNTQFKMPSGVEANGAGQRQEVTLGVSFFPTENLVFKADIQFRSDRSDEDPPTLINFGIGWNF